MLTGIKPHEPPTIVRSTSASRDQGKGSIDPIFLVLGVVAGLDRARIDPAGLVARTNFLPVDGGANAGDCLRSQSAEAAAAKGHH